MSAVFNQYLKTATGGNVHASRAVAIDRWYLYCELCAAKMTFAENYDIAEYEKKGILDSQIQAFAKEHLHLKPKFDPLSGCVNYMPDKGPFDQHRFEYKAQAMAEAQKKIYALKEEAKKKYELELIMAEHKIKIEMMKATMDKTGIKLPESGPQKKTEGRRFR